MDDIHDVTKSRAASPHHPGFPLLAATLDGVCEAAFLIDESSRFQFVNEEACRLLEYTREELLRLSVIDVDPDFPMGQWPNHWKNVKNRRSMRIESRHRTKSGRLIPVEISASHYEFEGKAYHLALARDISERKQAEVELREAYQFNEQILRSADEGIIVLDLHLRYQVWNPFMEKLSGVPASQVIGKHPVEVFPFIKDTDLIGRLEETLAGRPVEPVDFSYQIVGTDETGWATDTMAILRNSMGEPIGLIVMVRDITERVRADQRQAKLHARLEQTQKLESLGRLAGGVAHDMNNVLAAILALASANRERFPPGGETHRAFETISKAAIRGGKVVKGLLGFARQNPPEETELDLNQVIREVIQLLERTTPSKLHLEVLLAPDLHLIKGDASALAHAFMNLCVNAMDAMPEGGCLTLSTRNLDGDRIEAQVADTGTGMSQEVLDRALDPFFTTKGVGKGTGLGLSTVFSTVTGHRGEMELQSAPGEGTRVILQFPIYRGERGAESHDVAGEAEPPRRSLRVALVDDDDLVLVSMQALLGVMGHQCAAWPNGETALEGLGRGELPDLIILDLNMPGLGGIETLRGIRAALPSVPVLLSTGRPDQAASDLVLGDPHLSIISKPFDLEDLGRRIESLCGVSSRGGFDSRGGPNTDLPWLFRNRCGPVSPAA